MPLLAMQLVSNTNVVFNSPKVDCSRSYLLAMPPVAEPLLCLAALLAACSTHAYASCTLCSASSTVTSSWRQYPASYDDGRYCHPNSWMKIFSEVALESS
jgi:hypothetical protein